MLREAPAMIGISKSSEQKILPDDLGMSQVSARKIPRLLKEAEIENSFAGINMIEISLTK